MTNFSNVLTINFKTIVLKSIFQPPPPPRERNKHFSVYPLLHPPRSKVKKLEKFKKSKVDNAYFKRNLLTSIEFECLQFLWIKTRITDLQIPEFHHT